MTLSQCGSLLFQRCEKEEIEQAIIDWHYSHSVNTITLFNFCLREAGGGLFGDRGRIIAAVTYTIPVNRNQTDGNTLELTRLVRCPEGHPDLKLSYLVSHSLKWLQQNTPYKLVLSYADWTHNHHGGIYQACNFFYVGKSENTVQGFEKDGKVIHKKTAYDNYGTSAVGFMREQGYKPVTAKHKYLYVYPLARRMKERLEILAQYGYSPLRFPKPDWPDGMTPPDGKEATTYNDEYSAAIDLPYKPEPPIGGTND